MSYLSAPQTKMVATHCCVCGRALCDAVSVNRGIGPVCEKRHLSEAEDGARQAANKLVFEASCIFMSAKSDKDAADRLTVLTEELAKLGFPQLAEIVFLRALKPAVTLEVEEMTFGKGTYAQTLMGFVVNTRYARGFNEALKNAIDWRDRAPMYEGEGDDKKWRGWAVKSTPAAKKALNGVLVEFFSGERALGPKGPFTVAA